jgi:hypothetical protein
LQQAAKTGADGQQRGGFLVVAQPGRFRCAEAKFQLRQQADGEQDGAGGFDQRQAAGQGKPQQQRAGAKQQRARGARRKAGPLRNRHQPGHQQASSRQRRAASRQCDRVGWR